MQSDGKRTATWLLYNVSSGPFGPLLSGRFPPYTYQVFPIRPKSFPRLSVLVDMLDRERGEKAKLDFIVRELDTGEGWVIDAINADGSTEQLIGVFTSSAHALDWVAANLDRLKDRNT